MFWLTNIRHECLNGDGCYLSNAPPRQNMAQGNLKIGVTNESRLMCGRKIILSPVHIPYEGTLGTKQSNLFLPNVKLPTSMHESCDAGHQITQNKCRITYYLNLSDIPTCQNMAQNCFMAGTTPESRFMHGRKEYSWTNRYFWPCQFSHTGEPKYWAILVQ